VFTPSATAYAAGVPVLSAANPVQAVINSSGQLKNSSGGPLKLLATDNTGLTFEGLTGFFFWTVTLTAGGQGVPGWSFFLPHSPATVDLYTLANTAASGGFTNPMTTLGDIIYEHATPAAARLAGSTSAAKNFLTQTGTGSVSAAPAWGTIAPSDLASAFAVTFTFGSGGAVPSSGTFTTGQVVTDQNGVVRVCTAGGTPGTWARVGQKPHEFYVDDYGARGDGRIFTDGVTSGTTTFTSATAGFASADTGKHIMINGGNGAAAGPVLTTITFSNSTTVTLGSAAGASATACAFVYGTDDTAAISNAIAAGSAYAQANNFMFELVLSAKLYVSTALTQASSPAVVNTQIQVPYPAQNGQTRKLMVTLRGAGYMAPAQYWESVAPNVQGSAIVSMLTAPSTPDATFLQQSVIGGPSGTSGFTGGFANTHLTVRDMSVWCPAYTNIKALDMGVLSGCYLDGYSSNVFAPANNLAGAAAAHPYLADFPAQSLFTNSIGEGIRFPSGGNNDASAFGSIAVEGYEIGIRNAYDHLTGVRLAVLYCDVCIRADPGQTHELAIQSVSPEVYNGGIRVVAAGGNFLRLNIGWDSEASSVAYDLSDTSNVATGRFWWNDVFRSPATPAVTGAAGVKVINERIGPGHMASPPSVPGSTSTATLVYRDAWVSVHTGAGVTVSAITIDGTATGLTMAASSSLAVFVPSGKTIALTYAGGTPTWDWWLA